MRIALSDLGLRGIAVIYPGTKRYPIAHRVEAVPLAALADDSPIPPPISHESHVLSRKSVHMDLYNFH